MKSDLEPFAMVPRDLIGNVSPRALEVWAIMAAWYVRDEKVFRPPVQRIARALGCSRRTIEQALAELEKTGRLARRSGRAAGRANEYELRFCARRILAGQGAQNPAQGYAESCAGQLKVVNIPLKHTPPTPPEGGTPAREKNSAWQEFAQVYPRRDGLPAARQQFERLPPDLQAAAIAGARTLRAIYDAAPETRRRYTVRAARWLAEKRWTDPVEALETHYHVPGLGSEAAREAARKAANERRLAEFRGVKFVSGPYPGRNNDAT